MGNAGIQDKELHTIICGAEEMINSRPITYVSADPNEPTTLTPNHLIVGQIWGRFAPEAVEEPSKKMASSTVTPRIILEKMKKGVSSIEIIGIECVLGHESCLYFFLQVPF